jgi:glycosyltransferase involved in cell wall biosynthesis
MNLFTLVKSKNFKGRKIKSWQHVFRAQSIAQLSQAEKHKVEGGLRTQGNFKTSQPSNPLITVVTVVFNGEKSLEETIKSIITQTYYNIEYIIIDGNSTDNSLNIIRQYEHTIDYWMSSPDTGIYDAMNKGACLATGAWICFMNAGDTFYSLSTIDDIFCGSMSQYDVIYGNTVFNYDYFSKIVHANEISAFSKKMPFVHQSAFINSDLQRTYPFRTDLKIAADYDFFFKLYRIGKIFFHCDKNISVALPGGMSDSNRIRSVYERWRVVSSYGISFYQFIYFTATLCLELIKKISKVFLPKRIILMIQKR